MIQKGNSVWCVGGAIYHNYSIGVSVKLILEGWCVRVYRMAWDKLKIVYSGEMLEDNKVVIKDLGLKNNSSLTLFVDCMYWRRQIGKNASNAGASVREQQSMGAQARAEPKSVITEGPEKKSGEHAAKEATSDQGEENKSEEGNA